MIIEPHYPKIVLSFAYRGYKIEIDRDEFDGEYTYAAWVNDAQGCAVAVPSAISSMDAIRRAKQWIDKRARSI